MALTESKLRQIIKEEARKMMETSSFGRFGGRGTARSAGHPLDQDPNRDLAYGRGDRGGRLPFGGMGGHDEGWGDEDDDDGTGWDFNYKQKWKKGDRALYGRRHVIVTRASEVGPDVEFDYEDDGSHAHGHADDLDRP
jgi:hypothetical protein